jgi:hypothetical protein
MRYTVLSCRVMDANRPNGPTVAWCDDAEQAEKIAAALNAAEQRQQPQEPRTEPWPFPSREQEPKYRPR